MAVQYTPIGIIQKISQNNNTYTNSYKKKVREADADIEALQEDAEAFRKSVRALKRYSPGVTTKTRLEKQLKELAKSYNSMKKSAAGVTNEDVKKQLSELEDLFSENEKELKKIGLKKTDGKYEFDSDIFEEAEDKIIDSLLTGKDSFIRQADKIMSRVEAGADDAEYHYVERNISRTTRYEQEDMEVVALLTLAGEVTSVMKAYGGKIQAGTLEDADKENIEQDLIYLGQAMYITDKNEESENLEKLNQLCRDNENKLAQIGLKFDSEYKKLTYDENTDMSSDAFKSAFYELFEKSEVSGEPAFWEKLSKYSRNVFNGIIKPETIGISIIDTQI